MQYYDAHIEPEVLSACGRWILKPLGISTNGYGRVTTVSGSQISRAQLIYIYN